MAKAAERAGKPDVAELVRQGRLKYNSTRGLDPNPNPTVGNVVNPESGMRAGLTPEKYHKMVLLSERRRKTRKEWDFVPELEDYEWDVYIAWLKSGGPSKMKATGREAAKAQSQSVMELLQKYDPENAAKLESISPSPIAVQRDPIGSAPAASGDSEEEIELPADGEVPAGYDAIDPDATEEVATVGRRGRKAKTE